VQAQTLTAGEGYWSFSSALDSIAFTGTEFASATIQIGDAPRWALIGSVSNPVPLTKVQSNPSWALVASSIFGFDGTVYNRPSMIEPGKAYWVYVVYPCTITIGN
jgi:hypothetical protein